MLRGAAYVRVSTNDQTEYSPDAQKKSILDYASKNNILVNEKLHIYVDEGISGRVAEKRPAFQEMIRDAKKKPRPFDIILVHKNDRFARNREDSVVYKSLLRRECGIKVISVTESIEDDKFSIILESMLEAMAEYYSINLAEEVKKGMLEKARRGGIQQRPPFGYDIVDNMAIINPYEEKIVKLIYDQFVIEDKSYIEIANYVNALGYRTKEKNPFQSKGIKYILSNKFYTGNISWNKRNKDGSKKDSKDWICKKGCYKPIVSEELYDKAQKKINRLKKTGNRKQPHMYKHYLSGLLICKSCGGKLSYRTYQNEKYKYFRCRKSLEGGCSEGKHIRAEILEDAILQHLDKDFKYVEIITSHINEINTDISAINNQLKIINKKLEYAYKAYIEEVDTLEEYKYNKKQLIEDKKKIENKLSYLIEKSKIDKDKISNNIYKISDIIKRSDLNTNEKNKVLNSFIKDIIIDVKQHDIIIEYYNV